jgi:hypothetical protein
MQRVSKDTLEAICKLALSVSTPEAISLALDLNVQTVIQVLARGEFRSKDFDRAVHSKTISSLIAVSSFQLLCSVDIKGSSLTQVGIRDSGCSCWVNRLFYSVSSFVIFSMG